jgi:hypothetical protein
MVGKIAALISWLWQSFTKKNEKSLRSVYNTKGVKKTRRIGRDAMRNPWAVGLIIIFSLLFLIGLNIGETDFLYNLGRTI